MAAIAFWWLASANASWSLAADVVLDRDALGVGAHVAVLDRAPQAVVDGRVDERRRRRGGSRSGRPGRRYGAPFIDSMPPATTTSASPARISAAASMIALRPEPQTRLIVVARRRVREARPAAPPGGPAPGRRRPGGPGPSGRRRSRAVAGSRPARSTAARMATPPSSDGRDACSARRRTCRSAFAPR